LTGHPAPDHYEADQARSARENPPGRKEAMNWPEDFLDAHERHWEDAELLFGDRRWANADHLYGLAAECGLKALWPLITGRPPGRHQRVHVDRLWDQAARLAQGGRIAQLGTLPNRNPFHNWSVDQRYASRQHFTDQFVEEHRKGAEEIRNLVLQARRGGMI
jgi:HEPN domain-containing protein